MQRLRWAAPGVFAASFVFGYFSTGAHPPVELVVFTSILAFACGVVGFLPPARHKIWAGVNVFLTYVTARGMLDNALHHTGYSGFGALILVPLAVITGASLLALAFFSRSR